MSVMVRNEVIAWVNECLPSHIPPISDLKCMGIRNGSLLCILLCQLFPDTCGKVIDVDDIGESAEEDDDVRKNYDLLHRALTSISGMGNLSKLDIDVKTLASGHVTDMARFLQRLMFLTRLKGKSIHMEGQQFSALSSSCPAFKTARKSTIGVQTFYKEMRSSTSAIYPKKEGHVFSDMRQKVTAGRRRHLNADDCMNELIDDESIQNYDKFAYLVNRLDEDVDGDLDVDVDKIDQEESLKTALSSFQSRLRFRDEHLMELRKRYDSCEDRMREMLEHIAREREKAQRKNDGACGAVW